MRRAPRSAVAAALLVGAVGLGAVLSGCAPGEPPATVVTPPEQLGSQPPAVVAAPRPAGSIAPAVAVPEPPAPTASYRPLRPPSTAHESEGPGTTSGPTPGSTPGPTAPASTASPSASPSTSPSPRPSATPAPLVSLLPRAAGLGDLEWTDATGARTAAWTELAAPAATAPAAAITHVAAARSTDGACASAAASVDGRAIEAAVVSLAAEPAPGHPIDVVLVRYPSAAAAGDAVAALQALGVTCEGIDTDDGTLGSANPLLSATAVLRGDGAALVVEAVRERELLIAVLHEGAPPEAVTALVAAQRAVLT